MRRTIILTYVVALLCGYCSLSIAQLSGSYDIGGGNNHFPTLVAAADTVAAVGISASVTFNVYSGTYDGQVNLPGTIVGLSATNTLTFQNAPGESPLVTSTSGHGFYLTGADYITIQGLEITNCLYEGIRNCYTTTDLSTNNRFLGNYIHNVNAYGGYSSIYLHVGEDCEIAGNEIDGGYYGIYNNQGNRNLVVNNMIYNAEIYGICAYFGNSNEYYYNSVLISNQYAAVSHESSTANISARFMNNIYYQAGTGYAFSNSGTGNVLPLASDYNDLYAPLGNVGSYNGAQATLTDWQTATGLDSNSISFDPHFVSTTDLHIDSTVISPVGRAGIPVAGITVDFDGDLRDPVTPDIGADQFIDPLCGSYDVGGGNNDFPDALSAAFALQLHGVDGPVIFNIYSGTYNGQVDLPGTIVGLSQTNTVTFQNAPGESPIISSTSGHGFYLTGADYITIQGLEITNCHQEAIYLNYAGSDSSTHNRIIGNYFHDNGPASNQKSIYLVQAADCEVIGNEIDGDYYGIYIDYCKRNLIANNMMYNVGGYGIVDNHSDNDQTVYNSVYITAIHDVFHTNMSTNVLTKNNIFYQVGSGHAYKSGTSTPGLQSDYNDLYAPNSNVAYYYGIECPLLIDWQTATGVDSNSISIDPQFVSTTDLHIDSTVSSPVVGAGFPIAEITDDFDGDPRDPVTPDIGADEFAFPLCGLYDIGGGNNDFPNVVSATNTLQSEGVSGPVIFNTYSGTYPGEVYLPWTIPGLSASNPITFQNAPGEHPVVTNVSGIGFYIHGADYITIQGFEITDCYSHGIYSYYVGADSAMHNSFLSNYIHDVGFGGDYAAIHLSHGRYCRVAGNEICEGYAGIRSDYCNNNHIENNMIYNVSPYGIVDYCSDNDRTVHNSVYLNSSNEAFYLVNSTNVFLKNNILYQAGSGRTIRLNNVQPGFDSDYNDLYAPNGYIALNGADTCMTLADWQTATGLDSNSISADPFFTANENLHILSYMPSPVDSAAMPIAGINVDFDGEPRDSLFPDIGADEYTAVSYSHCVTLNPESANQSVLIGDTANFYISAANCGLVNDIYDITVSSTGAPWPHQIWDKTNTFIINAISLNAGTLDTFLVKVFTEYGAICEAVGEVVAVSRSSPRNILSDTSWVTTIMYPFGSIPYSWVEIAGPAGGPGINTGIIYLDQNVGPFPIGFNFPFYQCDLFDAIRICSNGFASFTSASTGITNYWIPYSNAPNNLIAPYWDDLDPSAGGSIWYYPDSVNNRFIVE